MKRMVLITLVSLLLAFGSLAHAGNNNDSPGGTVFNGSIHHNDVTLGGQGGSADVDNTNLNTNINTNRAYGGAGGSAIQGQLQGQSMTVNFGGADGPAAQGGQGGVGGTSSATGGSIAEGAIQNTLSPKSFSNSSSSSSSSSNANNNLELTFEDKRDFAPTLAPFGASPGRVEYGPKNMEKAKGWISLERFISLRGNIDIPEDAMESRWLDRDITYFVEPDRSNYPKRVKLWLQEPDGVEAIAVGTLWANKKKDHDNTTAAMVKEAARYCSRMGSSNMVTIKQTASSEAVSYGWGLGLAYNNAAMTNGGDMSQVGSGGTGYSRAYGKHRYALGLEFACVVPVK
jgi:hypothetical protein